MTYQLQSVCARDEARTGYHCLPSTCLLLIVRFTTMSFLIVVALAIPRSLPAGAVIVFVCLVLLACLRACQRPIQTAGRVSVFHAGPAPRGRPTGTSHHPTGVAGPDERSDCWRARLLVSTVARTGRSARACAWRDRGIGPRLAERARARRGLVIWSKAAHNAPAHSPARKALPATLPSDTSPNYHGLRASNVTASRRACSPELRPHPLPTLPPRQ